MRPWHSKEQPSVPMRQYHTLSSCISLNISVPYVLFLYFFTVDLLPHGCDVHESKDTYGVCSLCFSLGSYYTTRYQVGIPKIFVERMACTGQHAEAKFFIQSTSSLDLWDRDRVRSGGQFKNTVYYFTYLGHHQSCWD